LVHTEENLTQDHPRRHPYLFVLLFVAAIYVGCILSPPSLMDDVDAMQAQVARNMLVSGDWVTARLDGVVYLELDDCGLLQDFWCT
jgi:4-amino-4-deoxy-L-arabinose transferase-like glycosyltransferase